MSAREIKLYAILACLVAVGISTDYLLNMYTVTTSVIVDEAVSKMQLTGIDHIRSATHHRE